MNTLLRRLDKYLDANVEAPTVKNDVLNALQLSFQNYENPSNMTLSYAECNTLPPGIPYTPRNSVLIVGVTVTCNDDPRFIMAFYRVGVIFWIQLHDLMLPARTKTKNTYTDSTDKIDPDITDFFRDIDGWVNYMPRFVSWWNEYRDTERGPLRENTKISPHNSLGRFDLQNYLVDYSDKPGYQDWTLILSFHPDGYLHVSLIGNTPSDYTNPYIIPNNEAGAARVISKI
jgi:hypothetical protein